ncbi:hypothetical protein H0H92_011263 [Tricholoma furcatifolium]|nr:hypothetical protein H0H92_011263 [Tricholoma furcatifolium]
MIPFPKTHPQLSVSLLSGYIEFRIQNYHLKRDGSGATIYATSIISLKDVVCLVIAAYLPNTYLSLLVLLPLLYSKLTQILYESLIILPPHGIQLETHRGIPGLPLFTSRRFIPLKDIQDVIIHEGLRGWDVRFFLAAITRDPSPASDSFSVEVAFPNLLPQQVVLRYIQRQIQDQLFKS